ncbi:unnamed protein product [Penicillium salamii]|nr:unnamed protein product [Penicillium salamii]CAG8413526.1 unnamed protein product [Penicillium salamii]CAG8906565.1 unnamed protein product [Penicillium salamii]
MMSQLKVQIVGPSLSRLCISHVLMCLPDARLRPQWACTTVPRHSNTAKEQPPCG